jgi:hypothetical protein
MRGIMTKGAVGGKSDAAMAQTELGLLSRKGRMPKLSQTGTTCQRHIHLQLLGRFAGSGQAGKERAVEEESQHEVHRKEQALGPGEVQGEIAAEQR